MLADEFKCRAVSSPKRVVGLNHRYLFPFVCDCCGDRCISEMSEVEALEEARENLGPAVDKHPEKFMTVCQECFELLIEDSIELAAPMKREKEESTERRVREGCID